MRLPLLLCFALSFTTAGAQTLTSAGSVRPGGFTTSGNGGSPLPPSSQVNFSIPGGHYSSTQTVAIAGPSGTTCFYTTDGSTPNIASTKYVSPLSVSSNTTVKAICAQSPVVYQNVQASSTNWKCVTNGAHTFGSLVCQNGGGVSGTVSNASISYASSMSQSVSTTQATGENQILFVNTQAGCGGVCTMLAEDKIIQPTVGATIIANNEMDMNLNDASRSRYHAGGLQCNQQSGILQWQIDNQQGSWQNTGITYGCPLSTTQATEVRYTMHWTNGDAGCGGYGCDYYDSLTICVAGSCQDFTLNRTLETYTEPWSDGTIIQDQIDLTNTAQSGLNPTTGGRTITRDNVTGAVYSTLVSGSVTYTIP